MKHCVTSLSSLMELSLKDQKRAVRPLQKHKQLQFIAHAKIEVSSVMQSDPKST